MMGLILPPEEEGPRAAVERRAGEAQHPRGEGVVRPFSLLVGF